MMSPTINEPDNPDSALENSPLGSPLSSLGRPVSATETELRAEIDRLTRQLEKKNAHSAHSALDNPKRPSGLKIVLLLVVIAAAFVAAFFLGYIPHHRRDLQVIAEANVQNDALPDVTVVPVRKASAMGDLVVSGNIQAVTEAPILARAEGF